MISKYMDKLVWKVKGLAEKFFYEESGEVNVVAIVVLIAVAVVLALLFKDQIAGLITSMIEAITGKASEALAPV